VIAQLAAPAVALAAIGIPPILGRQLREQTTTRLVGASFAAAFVASVVMFAVLAGRGFAPEIVHVGTWFAVGHHAATIDLVADGLSVPYVCFSTGLCLLVNAFARKYLHREPGFTRFFVLLVLFGLGMNLMVLAGSIDVLFAGWEFIGISSMLLIGFFHERANAVQAAVRAFVTYRICDAGILAAGVVIHASVGSGDFDRLFHGGWPHGECLVGPSTAAIIAILLVFAALGKTAQVPFSGWLPRAMEGPTPSSAIFYGALSIHAGPYVLLRCEPLLDAAPAVGWLLVFIGGATALHANVVGKVQTDLKSICLARRRGGKLRELCRGRREHGQPRPAAVRVGAQSGHGAQPPRMAGKERPIRLAAAAARRARLRRQCVCAGRRLPEDFWR
jgi:NADH:ubiquinone oxidoreductase subunit 5 (subunit L)/multisubunit Na+/H+ antiporter MnhA subunit